jgi:predicted MFS family arabinose efflux permease
MAKALRHLPGGRPVALLLSGLAASALGDWMYNVALLALVFERTGSPTWVAVTTAARVLPLTVLGPFGGVLADRVDRQWLMIAGDVVRALLMVALTAVAVLGLPVVLVPALAGLATGAGVAHQTCVATAVARFVDESDLARVSGLRAGIYQGSIVAGPAVGALLLALWSPAAVILANASTFLFSAAAVSAIAPGPAFRPGRTGEAAPSVLADVRTGAAALRGAPVALRMLGADLVCSTVYGFLTVALVLVGMRAGVGTDGYGVLLGAFGVGGVLGAAVSGRRSAAARWRRTLAIALTLVALPIAGLGLAASAPEAIALALVAGGGMVVAEVLTETALPQMVDDDVLARAYGLVVPASVTGIVAGSLVAAPVVAVAGLSGALAGVGALVAIMAALLLREPRPAGMPRVALAESGA